MCYAGPAREFGLAQRARQGEGMPAVFLSYNRSDITRIMPIIHALQREGVWPWYDRRELAQAEWRNTIPKKISDAAATVVFWTPNSVESKTVREEADLARRQDKLIQVSLGAPPAFSFAEENAELFDLADIFNRSMPGWPGFLNEVKKYLRKVDPNTFVDNPTGHFDWTSWCGRSRGSVLESIAKLAIDRAVVFLSGEPGWCTNHLSALVVKCGVEHVLEANPRAEDLEEILNFNETKTAANVIYPFWQLNSVFAATAFEFVKIKCRSRRGGLVKPSYRTNPASFAEFYFTYRLNSAIFGQTKALSLSDVDDPSECIDYFVRFLGEMLADNSMDGHDVPYIVIWPVDLLDRLLNDPLGARRKRKEGDENNGEASKGGKPLLEYPGFRRDFLTSVRDYPGNAEKKVGLIVKTSKFVCEGWPLVARNAALLPPPLTASEITLLLAERFPKTPTLLDPARVLEYTGGAPIWLDLLLDFVEFELKRHSDLDDVSRAAFGDAAGMFLVEMLENPAHAKEGQFEPRGWLIKKITQIREEVETFAEAVRLAAPYFRERVTGRGPTQEWTNHIDSLLRAGLVSLTGSDETEPVERFTVFRDFNRVKLRPLSRMTYAVFHSLGLDARVQ